MVRSAVENKSSLVMGTGVAPSGVVNDSFMTGAARYPGNSHWDLAIVYPVKLLQPVRRPPWWRVLGFVEKSRLRAKQFGWNADFVRDLGIVA
ncbi:MAG: hypothetical protein E6K99_09195 [Thaumarchaeota archaeon]|nr:MAG: hypothetical protein E6K99_09195 [Nitrososphaerota archaeon]